MTNPSELALTLCTANLELQARLLKLFQQNGEQWLDLGYRAIKDGTAESDIEVKQLLDAHDWQTLATLPAESFWRQLQQRFGDSQAAAQIAINSQTSFAAGLQEAVQIWQQKTTQAFGASALPSSNAWTDLFKPLQQVFSTGFPPTPEATPKPGTTKRNG